MENGGFINASVDTFQTASLAQSWNHCVFCCRFCTCCKWGTEGFPMVVSAAPYSTSTTEAHMQPPPTANKEHLQHVQHLFGDCFSMFFRLSFFNVSEMKLKWYMNYQSDVYISLYISYSHIHAVFGCFWAFSKSTPLPDLWQDSLHMKPCDSKPFGFGLQGFAASLQIIGLSLNEASQRSEPSQFLHQTIKYQLIF